MERLIIGSIVLGVIFSLGIAPCLLLLIAIGAFYLVQAMTKPQREAAAYGELADKLCKSEAEKIFYEADLARRKSEFFGQIVNKANAREKSDFLSGFTEEVAEDSLDSSEEDEL